MKRRTIVCFLLVLGLLFTGAALAGSSNPLPASGYNVSAKSISGQGYHLSGLSWQATGSLHAPGYTLTSPSAPSGSGTMCCCNYIPCVVRKTKY